MKVRHPQYGVGTVRSLTEHTAEIVFDDARRDGGPGLEATWNRPEATATLSELQIPLTNLIRDTARAVVEALGLEQRGCSSGGPREPMAAQNSRDAIGRYLAPAKRGSARDFLLDKIVMIRNNLRVPLEQKVNASDKLSDADEFDLAANTSRAATDRLTHFQYSVRGCGGRPVQDRRIG